VLLLIAEKIQPAYYSAVPKYFLTYFFKLCINILNFKYLFPTPICAYMPLVTQIWNHLSGQLAYYYLEKITIFRQVIY
jgi:hypothetical protein